MIEIVVHGEPAPQGSKTRTRYGVREDNPNTRPWRAAVAAEAAQVMGDRPPLEGAFELVVRFYFKRPDTHYGTGRNAGTLKQSAPTRHRVKPDADKLLRAIGDALAGKVVRDDSRFAVVRAEKLYGSPRAEIVVRELEP